VVAPELKYVGEEVAAEEWKKKLEVAKVIIGELRSEKTAALDELDVLKKKV